MLRIGYLDELVAAELLHTGAEELARIIASNPLIAVRGIKHTPNEITRNKLDEAADDRRSESLHGEKLLEGNAAFAEKRPPRHAGAFPTPQQHLPCAGIGTPYGVTHTHFAIVSHNTLASKSLGAASQKNPRRGRERPEFDC